MAFGTVTSADGTTIAFQQEGSGPPMVLVHGATIDHECWMFIIPLLQSEYTLYALDRRGRGQSGDSPVYAPGREVEDLQALLEHIGEPVYLVGHSSGAVLSLMLAECSSTQLRRMVLYEPPIFEGSDRMSDDLPAQLRKLLAAEDRDETVATFFAEATRTPDRDIAGMRSTPIWARAVSLAHTMPYDAQIATEYKTSKLSDIDVPTLMLMGSESPQRIKDAAMQISKALPDCTVEVLPGQEHVAMYTAPDLLADAISKFCAA